MNVVSDNGQQKGIILLGASLAVGGGVILITMQEYSDFHTPVPHRFSNYKNFMYTIFRFGTL